MQANPRKSKIIALSIALFFSAVALVDTFVSDKFGGRYAPIGSANSLALLKMIVIFISAYGLVVVVAFQFWRTSLLNRLSTRRSRFSPETRFLAMNYPFLVAPALYGQLLYYCGMSISEFFYFVGASIVMIVAWAYYDFRKT